MKNRVLSLIVVAAAWCTSGAYADPIVTWSAPLSDTGAATDVLTNGTVIDAFVFQSPTLSVNGVTFPTGSGFGPNGLAYCCGPTGTADFADPNYNAMLSYPLGGSGDVVIDGLTIGDTYQLQIFEPYFDGDSNPGPSELILNDGAPPSNLTGASGAVASGDSTDIGQYVVATFTADSRGMAIWSYNAAHPEFNLNGGGNGAIGSAFILIEDPTGPTTPEPGTLLLLGSGLLAAGRFTRRKVAAQAKN
jgi:hypothetical protein